MPRRLTDLADVLRGAGLIVDETAVPDWRDRSRSGNTSWYADGRPTHVMVHHTASSIGAHDTIADERREARACGVLHEVKPVSNVYLGPSGIWYPLAAGPSNTNGAGLDTWGGGVPPDSMNSYSVAVEAGNNGIGEAWPQLDSYVRGVAAMCKAWGIPPKHVRAHFEWAPTRKIDPASGQTATPYSPHDRWGKFDMDTFRRDVAFHLAPPPDTEGETMFLFRGPSGQMYATNRDYRDRPIAFAVSEDDGAMLRDHYGYDVAADTGPHPIDADEERVIRAVAGLGA